MELLLLLNKVKGGRFFCNLIFQVIHDIFILVLFRWIINQVRNIFYHIFVSQRVLTSWLPSILLHLLITFISQYEQIVFFCRFLRICFSKLVVRHELCLVCKNFLTDIYHFAMWRQKHVILGFLRLTGLINLFDITFKPENRFYLLRICNWIQNLRLFKLHFFWRVWYPLLRVLAVNQILTRFCSLQKNIIIRLCIQILIFRFVISFGAIKSATDQIITIAIGI